MTLVRQKLSYTCSSTVDYRVMKYVVTTGYRLALYEKSTFWKSCLKETDLQQFLAHNPDGRNKKNREGFTNLKHVIRIGMREPCLNLQ